MGKVKRRVYQFHFCHMNSFKLLQRVSRHRLNSSHELTLSVGHTLPLDTQEGWTKLRVKDEQVSIELLLTLFHFPE